jgi:hypothetical protein
LPDVPRDSASRLRRCESSETASAVPHSGDISAVAPPVPIPNTEVKRCSPDGSTAIGRARVGRRQSKMPDGLSIGHFAFWRFSGERARLGCWFSRPAKTNFTSSAALPTHTEQIAFVTPLVVDADPDDEAVQNVVARDRSESLFSNAAVLSRSHSI